MEAVRDELESTIWAFDHLDEEARFDMIGFIESFFTPALNERFIEREISPRCSSVVATSWKALAIAANATRRATRSVGSTRARGLRVRRARTAREAVTGWA